jgi:hypothetical protein
MANNTKLVAFVTDNNVATVDGNDWDVFARPIAFFQHFNGCQFFVLDRAFVRFTLILNGQASSLNPSEKVFAISVLGRAIA